MRLRKPLLITMDGPAASGKSTIARKLAKALGLPYLYTGAMYRAVTWLALRRGIALDEERALARVAQRLKIRFRLLAKGAPRVFIEGTEVTRALQHPDISRLTSSHVAMFRRVREALVGRQRRFLTRRGLVAEGRDCGSVIFPDAPYKFYLTATREVRALRRRRDLARVGIRIPLMRIRRELARRDREDQTRPLGALLPQPDAWIIDNTHLEQRETIARMLRRIGRVSV